MVKIYNIFVDSDTLFIFIFIRKGGEFSFQVQDVLGGIAKFFCKAFLYCLLSKNIFDPVVYLGHSPPVQVTLREV